MKEIICIVCPNGCTLNVEKNGEEITVTGNKCKRGEEFAGEIKKMLLNSKKYYLIYN